MKDGDVLLGQRIVNELGNERLVEVEASLTLQAENLTIRLSRLRVMLREIRAEMDHRGLERVR